MIEKELKITKGIEVDNEKIENKSQWKPSKVSIMKGLNRLRLITSALPYINNVPHLGHMVGSHLPAIFLLDILGLNDMIHYLFDDLMNIEHHQKLQQIIYELK